MELKGEHMNIGYIRVSTSEQVNHGHSLYGQEEKLKNYSVLEGLKNIEVFKDEGYSAGSDKRPKYKKIIKLIKQGKVNNLIITKVDRISRNIVDFNNLINLCLKYDVNLVSIEDSLNLSTAMGRCMANIIMSMAQMEREQISERTISGVEAGLKKGYYSLGGTLPLGIKRTKDNKLKYTPEIEIVKYMFKLDKQGYSYVMIKEKVKKKYDYDLKSKNKVEDIIKNELYRGFKTYNGNKYFFLKPIIEDEYTKEKIKQINRKRQLKKHTYLFEKQLGDEYNVQTIKKYIKNENKYVEYKYYTSKETGMYISEKHILHQIKETINKKSIDINIKMEQYYKRLKILYIKGHVDIEELNYYKDQISKKAIDINIIETIKDLKIDQNKNITFNLKSN